MDKNNIKVVINIVLFLVAVGILVYFCINENNLYTLIKLVPTMDYFWMTTSVLSIFASWLCDGLVVRSIISDVLKKKYNLYLSLRVTMCGQFFSSITPLGVAGQPMQTLELKKQNIEMGKSVSIVVRKFLIYQTTLAFYSLIVILLKTNMFVPRIDNFIILTFTGFFSQCFIIILLILFSINKNFTMNILKTFIDFLSRIKIIKDKEKSLNKTESELDFFLENNKSMNKNLKLSIKTYVLTFLQITFLFLVPFFIYKAFNNPGYPIMDMISAQSFLNTISSYTPLPGAAGTTEHMFLTLFNLFFDESSVPPAMIFCRLITYYLGIILSYIFIKISLKEKYITNN